MEAPTPVSAYLHSATMVKAGVYLLMRLNPVMGETVWWETVLPVFGGATLIVGTLLAMRQTDLKLMLAYTTVASLGLLVMLTGFGSEKAIAGAVLYLVAHSLFKGGLFMVAGLIDHEAGTRDVTRLGGLRKAMPVTFIAALLGAISMGGLPPFFGFLAKEEIYYGLGHRSLVAGSSRSSPLSATALMFVIGFAVALKPFLGPEGRNPETRP
jgi:multicomponent Na+:H+ antiporter subunit A